MLLIQTVASATRDLSAKRALYHAVADRRAAKTELRHEDVQIVLISNARENCSFGSGIACYAPE